ncbi:MAG: hypothetical protein ABIN68_01220 [Sphingomicrobium sp.]
MIVGILAFALAIFDITPALGSYAGCSPLELAPDASHPITTVYCAERGCSWRNRTSPVIEI